MTPRLVAISGPFEGQTFEIEGDRFVIGRGSECDLRLAQIEISRRHCEIEAHEGSRFFVRDLDSRHGTQVNGRAIREVALAHSDLLLLGANALLFLLDDSSASGEPPALSSSQRGASVEGKVTLSLHLDPERVNAALPAQARLARELHSLLRLSTTLQEYREIGSLSACLLDAALEAIPAAGCGAVLLREPGLDQPVAVAERGRPRGLERLRSSLSEKETVCRPLPTTATGSASPTGETGTYFAAPLSDADGEAFGWLYLEGLGAGQETDWLELVAAMAGVASLAFQNVLHLRWLEGENRRLRDEDAARHDMIGESEAIRAVFDLVARVARADSTVLIQGESGTGKELVARAIHRSSPRAGGPFVAVNCATLSDNLLESELFGHEKGAFTGALARKIGKMEAAHRGTLFLDEVAEIPVGLQAKLLRALQEREIERVGGIRPIPVDIRVVAASHRELAAAVRDGSLREDLFFRLRVIVCRLPSLRERREDIPLLARHFASRHGEKLGFAAVGIAPEARRCLMAYDWPGNVRELGNAIERAVVLGDGEVLRREDLPDEVAAIVGGAGDPSADAAEDFQGALVAFKKQLILDAWKASGEDYARTAERLGVHVNSLHRMVKNLGLKESLGR